MKNIWINQHKVVLISTDETMDTQLPPRAE